MCAYGTRYKSVGKADTDFILLRACAARFWGTLSKSLILSKGQVLILSYLLFNRAAINYNLIIYNLIYCFYFENVLQLIWYIGFYAYF